MRQILPRKYKFLKTLQDSVNSKVILAIDKESTKKVVFKYILPESPFYQGFFEECLFIKEAEHPNLIKLIGSGFHFDGASYYIMPYYEKIDPLEYCKRRGTKGFLEISWQILKGLNFLHERDKLHGDISIDNVLFYLNENGIQVKISDFGLSSLIVAKHLTDISGTANYLAPELITNPGKTNLTKQSDLYALGILFSIILIGKLPESNTAPLDVLKNRIKTEREKIVPAFPVENEIIMVVEKLLSFSPRERYQSCSQVVRDIHPFIKKYNISTADDNSIDSKIKFNLYREKVVKTIVNYVQKSQIVKIIGDKKDAIDETISFLALKLIVHNNLVFRIDDQKENSNIIEIIQKNLPVNIIFKNVIYTKNVIFILDMKAVNKNFVFLNKLIEQNKKFKLIIVDQKNTHQESEFSVKIRKYKLPKLANKEFENYLNLIFGKNVLPAEIKDFINKNANRNLILINEFLQILQKEKVISKNELSWHFSSNEIAYDFYNEEMIKKHLSILKTLNQNEMKFLTSVSFWKDIFTIKEIQEIFQFSIIKIQDHITELKKKDLLIQDPHNIKFQYAFFKKYIQESASRSLRFEIIEKVIIYFRHKDNLEFSDKMMYFKYLQKNKHFSELLEKAIEIYHKLHRNREFVKLEKLGKIINYSRNDLIKIHPDNLMYILFNYELRVRDRGNYDKSKEVYAYLKKNIDYCEDNFFKNELIMKKLQYFQAENNYSEITLYYEKNCKEINLWSNNQKARILHLVSSAYFRINKIKISIKIIKEMIEICQQTKKLEYLLSAAYSNLGFYFYRLNENKNALKYYIQAKNLAEKDELNFNLGYIYCRIAFINFELFQFKKAKEFYKKAEFFKNKRKIYYFMGLISNGMGHINLYEGNFWDALNYFQKNKKDCMVTRNKYYYHMIARTLSFIGYYDQAEFFILRSLKLAKSKKNLLKYFTTIYLFILFFKKDFKMFCKVTSELTKTSSGKEITIIPEFYYIEGIYYHSIKSWEEMKTTISDLKHKFDFSINPNAGIYYHNLNALFLFENDQLTEALKFIEKTIKKLKIIKNNLIEAPEIYYNAYLITKKAFDENLTTENYKKYLKVAHKLIQKRKNNLPTNPMRRTYLEQENVKKIVNKYEEEMIKKRFSETSTILLELLEDISKIITNVTDENKLFTKILEIAISVTGAERGLILTLDQETKKQHIRYSVKVGEDSLKDITSVSKKIISDVFRKKQAVYSTKVASNEVFDPYRSFVNLKIESIICLPLIIHKQILGTVYLDSRSLLAFTPEEIKFLNVFAQIAASAIETSQYYCRLEEEKKHLADYLLKEKKGHENIIGNSPQILSLLKKIEQIAPTDVNVLIEGESGTGKELVAKDIHQLSRRKDKLFIPIDCGSLSENIIESELFGHIKGAFTGAISDKKGLFEEANDGTVFLDEISNISLNMQTKLLRLIQEGEFKRVGENKVRKVNTRIIVASNLSLKKLVVEGKFRQDLYYRLSIFPIEIPPLRERIGDVRILAKHFLDYYNIIHQKNIKGFQDSSLKILEEYSWQGNVRQLQNEIERAVIVCEEKRLSDKDFQHLKKSTSEIVLQPNKSNQNFNGQINDYKLAVIKKALKDANDNWTKAAEILGLSRQNLRQIYQRLDK
ncbi:MAG: sigma 54-interacting transcriptional regulator [Candidatus Cloacimonetes bacterium]|nr:sigma 54-interacting transcriptional regulator [Candidatus Cloacimonadota bacterium]